MDVYKWTPRVAREIKKAYKDAKEAFYLEGFQTLYAITKKPKFVELVAPDCDFLSWIPTEEGYMSVYIESLGE